MSWVRKLLTQSQNVKEKKKNKKIRYFFMSIMKKNQKFFRWWKSFIFLVLESEFSWIIKNIDLFKKYVVRNLENVWNMIKILKKENDQNQK